MINILFLGDTDGDLSQIAVAFARRVVSKGVNIIGAGLFKTREIHPVILRTMGEIDVDVSYQNMFSFEEIPKNSVDIIITLTQSVAEKVKFSLPGDPIQLDWELLSQFSGDKIDAAGIKLIRDKIKQLVNDFFNNGYYKVFKQAENRNNYVLDSFKCGIIVHDVKRRITYFNSKAEEITGYKKKEVVGNDCHQVFHDKFCGDKCSFCDDLPDFTSLQYPLQVKRKDGFKVGVNFEARAIKNNANELIGVLALFDYKDREKQDTLTKKRTSLVDFHGILSKNKEMFKIFDLVESVAKTNVPVLIQGASGTGKELIAKALHEESLRNNQVFLPINCGALPENLLESELFGYVKGAFTGAIKDKKGRFQLADGGTIFLDEIAEISAAMQVKLLRVIQEGTFERLGDTRTIKTNVRIISATNKDLKQQVIKGEFREDLYYRLCVIPINLPLLYQRKEDISDLANLFIYNNDIGINNQTVISDSARHILISYHWPGNIRELQNTIQYALIKSQGLEILPSHLPPETLQPSGDNFTSNLHDYNNTHEYIGLRKKLTIQMVKEVLLKTDGNKAKAARLLGVGRATLYRFLSNHPDLDKNH